MKFLGQRGTFSQENIPGKLLIRGTTHVSFHKHSHCSPNNLSMSKQPPKSRQSQQNNYKTRYLPQNREASGFRTAFMHQVTCYLANSVNTMLTGNVLKYAKTTFSLRPCEKQGKTLSNQRKRYFFFLKKNKNSNKLRYKNRVK